MSELEEVLNSRISDLLVPNKELTENSLKQVKNVLDPIAKGYSIFDSVHVEGLDAEQVWAQAQMIVDGAVDKLFVKLGEMGGAVSDPEEEESGESDEIDSAEEQSEDELLEGEDSDVEQQLHDDFDEEDFEGFDVEDIDVDQAEAPAEGQDQDDDDDELVDEPDRTGLNTGLFNLKEFQEQVLAMENDDEEDDGEEIDYFKQVPDESDGEDDGDLKYNDFFAPPKKKAKITKKEKQAFVEDEQIEEAFDSARKDLFDDEDDFDEDDQMAGEQLSKFERQQLELQKQIDQLESENVGEKFWAVKGEVKATQRPQDSLINTEIEFERNAKPAPVITQEVTDSLEDMIRERIKKQQFDDIPRRIQGVEHKSHRELAELSEQKSEKNLAEEYEDEQMRQENPEYYASKDNAQLEGAHKEIKELYSQLSRKLDALSSWHFTPKAPKPSLAIVADTAAISMEEAQPTAMSTSSMLAPQEIYQSGSKSKGEVVGRNNLPVSRDEMSTEDKHKARRKAKAKKAKELAKKDALKEQKNKTNPPKKDSKEKMFDTLKKGNVAYLDKRGEKRDLKGNVIKEAEKKSSHMKL